MSEFLEDRLRVGAFRGADPEVQYRTIHGYRRAFLDVGDGPPLLMIHGIGDSSDSWRPVLERLTTRYRVIAPDLLGHGKSEKPRADYSIGGYANGMRDLLAVLGIDRVTIVGHSLGGGVAAQFAYQYPERCERLVFVGSGGVGRTVSPLLRLATVPGAEVLMPFFSFPAVRSGSRAIGHLAAAIARRMRRGIGRDIDEIISAIDALPNARARQAILRTLRSGVDWRGQAITMLDRAYLAEGVPTLIVWGEEDAIIPVGHAHLAHSAIPGSRMEIFEDAGHFPHHSHPDRFVDLLFEFFSVTDSATFDVDDWRERLSSGRGNERDAAVRT